MQFGTWFLMFILTYYTYYILVILLTSKRESVIMRNIELDTLRKVPIKSIDDQKRFLELKYPSGGRFDIWGAVWQLAIMIPICYTWLTVFRYYDIDIQSIWFAMLAAGIVVVLSNVFLSLFRCEDGELKELLKI